MNEPSFAIIRLTQGRVAIVDPDRYAALNKFTWRAVKAKHNWYAKTTIYVHGSPVTISMHRFIARTPRGWVCHHIDGNSLNNQRDNLINMTKQEHTAISRNDKILVLRRDPEIPPAVEIA